MPAICTFTLNGKKLSSLICPTLGAIPAFSGFGSNINQPAATSQKMSGPLPTGTYYVVDRPTGGLLQPIEDLVKDRVNGTKRSEWFALYRADKKIDDFTVINGIKRGNFRLHPVGRVGISEGCITLPFISQFETLRKYLLSQKTEKIPGTQMDYYAKVIVR